MMGLVQSRTVCRRAEVDYLASAQHSLDLGVSERHHIHLRAHICILYE